MLEIEKNLANDGEANEALYLKRLSLLNMFFEVFPDLSKKEMLIRVAILERNYLDKSAAILHIISRLEAPRRLYWALKIEELLTTNTVIEYFSEFVEVESGRRSTRRSCHREEYLHAGEALIQITPFLDSDGRVALARKVLTRLKEANGDVRRSAAHTLAKIVEQLEPKDLLPLAEAIENDLNQLEIDIPPALHVLGAIAPRLEPSERMKRVAIFVKYLKDKDLNAEIRKDIHREAIAALVVTTPQLELGDRLPVALLLESAMIDVDEPNRVEALKGLGVIIPYLAPSDRLPMVRAIAERVFFDLDEKVKNNAEELLREITAPLTPAEYREVLDEIKKKVEGPIRNRVLLEVRERIDDFLMKLTP